MNEIQDKYILKENYHGDIKITKLDKPKKVNLSKPTDILDHKVKNQLMPNVYSNSNPPSNSKQRVCLTKSKDIISKEEKSMKADILLAKIIAEEKLKREKNLRMKVKLIFTIIVAIIPIIAYVLNDGLEFQDTMVLIFPITILICRFIQDNKK